MRGAATTQTVRITDGSLALVEECADGRLAGWCVSKANQFSALCGQGRLPAACQAVIDGGQHAARRGRAGQISLVQLRELRKRTGRARGGLLAGVACLGAGAADPV